MPKPGNYNVFGVIQVLATFPTITVPGYVPIFRIDRHICLMPQGLLIASFLACYFQEGMLGIVVIKMLKIVLNQNTLAIAVQMEHSITTRGITVDPGHFGPNNTAGAIVALCTRCWRWCRHPDGFSRNL
jgi:hypothetical protein